MDNVPGKKMETPESKGLKWAEASRTGVGIGGNNSLVDRGDISDTGKRKEKELQSTEFFKLYSPML